MVITVHIPTLTCGRTLINPCPLTPTCVFTLENSFHCAGTCTVSNNSLLPCTGVYLHIPLSLCSLVCWQKPTHTFHIVCTTIILVHALCLVVGTNTTNMAYHIHFSCHQQFQWVDPKAENDMFVEYLKGIRLSPLTIILTKDMFGVCHVIRQLWDFNFHATYTRSCVTRTRLYQNFSDLECHPPHQKSLH